MEYKSIKGKLSGVTKDKCCKYSKFKHEDRYTIGKYAPIHGIAAVLQKLKNQFHIIDSIKAQLGLYMKNTIELSSPHHDHHHHHHHHHHQ